MKKFIVSLLFLALFLTGASAKDYVLDGAHSSVEFSVKHLMISSVKGNFDSYKATFAFDPATKTFSELKATVDTTSVNTANQKRDDHLRSPDFFDAANHPTLTFVMKSYVANGDVGVMKGDLTIRGITRSVELKTTINGIIADMQGKERVGFTLEGKVDRKDFGLTWNRALEAGGVVVGDEVKITVEVQMVAS
ncbi:polyisoprenoid-binding protein [Sulfurospirillum sp. T05]|uniref:Polyisoprenoid-binding protein n=1 Tax=Sulfurospirillum tamanense TaxID=2813362 RepID=A0ABS2WV02_9BACT|nr:YceI family protein [Sulfurospirillum tamanensis]MBN2965019.1 polyisoprenoid-binding protein [Sulfurospirillum tamanensis]